MIWAAPFYSFLFSLSIGPSRFIPSCVFSPFVLPPFCLFNVDQRFSLIRASVSSSPDRISAMLDDKEA